jgi:hypothetical protein
MSFIGAGKEGTSEGFVLLPYFGTIETNVFTPYKINSGSQIYFARMESLGVLLLIMFIQSQ